MKYMSKKFSRQMSGQIGIIVILITAAILTFSLSVADRVVEESKVVVDRSDSIRVFNVAETGVDEALNQIYQYETGALGSLPTGVDILPDNEFNQVSITSNLTYGGYLDEGESLRIKLNQGTGNINIKWSETACNVDHRIGILLSLIHLKDGQYQSTYYLVTDTNNTNCLFAPGYQHFIDANYSATDTYKYSYNLALTPDNSTDATLYVQTVGDGTELQVSGGVGLIAEAQYQIDSLATSGDDISNKTIVVTKSLPSAPTFMTFALFSGGNILK